MRQIDQLAQRVEVVALGDVLFGFDQAELLPALGVTWVDSRPLTLEHHGRDGIHFTRSGSSAWAQGALPTVTSAVAPAAVVADTQTA